VRLIRGLWCSSVAFYSSVIISCHVERGVFCLVLYQFVSWKTGFALRALA